MRFLTIPATLRCVAVLTLIYCAACDSPIEPQLARSSVRITPNPLPVMIVGSSMPLTAETSDRLTLRWETRDSVIAIVSPDGVVAARKAGTTFVVASGIGDPSARDSVAVTVQAEPPIGGATSTVHIDWVRDGATGAAVDPDAVRSFVEIGARTDVHPALTQSMLRITLNDEPVCAEPFGGRQRFVHRCVFDSRRFQNGEARVRALMVRPDGAIVAISATQSFTIAN